MQKVTVLLEKDLIQKGDASYIHYKAENALAQHGRLGFSCFTALREFALRDYPQEYFISRCFHGVLHYEAGQYGREKDSKTIRIALCALWIFAVELAVIVEHSNDVQESPTCRNHDARVEEDTLGVHQTLETSVFDTYIFR